MIIEEIAHDLDATQRKFEGLWGMSGVGKCQKELLAIARGTMTGHRSNAAIEGKLHEIDIINRLRGAGYDLDWVHPDQQEVSMVTDDTEWPLVGHPDGLIWMDQGILTRTVPPYLLELKSKGIGLFTQWKKYMSQGGVRVSNPVEYVQIQCYMGSPEAQALRVKACLYIVKCRDNGELQEEIIRYDPEWLHNFLMTHFAPVVDAYQNNANLSEMSCNDDPLAKRWCPLRSFCGDGEAVGVVKALTVDDPTIKEAIQGCMIARAMENEAKALKETNRPLIQQFLIKEGIERGVIDGVTVQMIKKIRTKFDKNRALELIPEEMHRDLMTTTESEELRIG